MKRGRGDGIGDENLYFLESYFWGILQLVQERELLRFVKNDNESNNDKFCRKLRSVHTELVRKKIMMLSV
jgi:hypothetical protein